MSAVHVDGEVERVPVTLTGSSPKGRLRMRGTVVWIHPAGRYHVVAFPVAGGVVRECFQGAKLEQVFYFDSKIERKSVDWWEDQ